MSRKLGNKLKSIRLKRNLSQTEMANILGYSGKGMISRLENDSAEMSYDKLMILLSRFGDEFEGEEIEPIIPVVETSYCFKTDNLLIKVVGFNELEDALSLKVAPYQRGFVADNAISFAEAYAAERHGTKTECFVAYKENHPVGFASIAFGTTGAEGEKKWMCNSYCLWRLMIDMDYQNKGFGKELLEAMIKWCETFPFGESDTIYTSCDIANKKAIHFYQRCGFELTGDYIDGEIVLRKHIEEGK